MNLKHMRYFLAVAQEANFGRAAQRLHIAQPPLTRQIRALEEELGTDLFVRTTKGAELTEAGEVLLAEVPNILSLVQRAKEQTQLASQGMIGRLDIGIFSSGVLYVIPQLLARFHAQRPGVRIGLHNMNKYEQIEALRERRISIGFTRFTPQEDDIAVGTILQEPFMVALYEEHPLCKQTLIKLADLAGESIILYPNFPTHGLAQEVRQAFEYEGCNLTVGWETEDFITAIALVASRLGLCITTASVANLNLPGVVYRPLISKYLQYIELNYLYRHNDNSPALRAFLDVVQQYQHSE
ncbi:HTH-type transcriptional regulator TfdS [Lonepinella sp. MS14434]|uniref:LysR family transcriptional regulator n=1 Tax=Lonepinella sp. MS14434 TaxID=3003617 RepID=UPI0036DB0D24